MSESTAEANTPVALPPESEAATGGEYKSEDARVRRLVAHLDHLAQTSDKISASRAALAELRQAIRDPLRGAKHVAPYLGSKDLMDEARFYQAASLFAHHRKHQNGVSFGTALRASAEKRGSDSIEGRFVALLSASSEQLFDRLVGIVTLLKADEQPLDWCKVLDDMRQWSHPEKRRQHALARDFYRKAGPDEDAATSEAK